MSAGMGGLEGRTRVAARRLACLLAGLVAGCDGDEDGAAEHDVEPPPPRQLVTAEGWAKVAAADDVFAAMRPGRTECQPVEGFGPVDFGGYAAFEVHTDVCNYATVTQPLGDDVLEGETINVRMWHFDLRSAEPATGVVAVAVEGEVRWEYQVDIPADGALASWGWVTDHDIPRGTPVQFHVRNHGINSWNLIEITAATPED